MAPGLALPWPARAGEPPTDPILQIETGMHVAAIKAIAADSAGSLLLTVSDDKTARIWSPTDGRLLRILRPPIGLGNEGKLFAGVLSPDGQVAAVAGWTGWSWNHAVSIYLFSTSSGQMLKEIGGLESNVNVLTFSPDGRFLAAGMAEGGLQVWFASSWKPAWQDSAYDGEIYGISYTRSNVLVSTCHDGYLRAYDMSGRLKSPKVKAAGGLMPHGIAVAGDGTRAAISYADLPRVEIVSVPNLSVVAVPDMTGMSSIMQAVRWSNSGNTLFAAGRAQDQSGHTFIRSWTGTGLDHPSNIIVAQDSLFSLAGLPGGRLAFAAADPLWGVLDNDSKITLTHKGEIARYRSSENSFLVSQDGKTVQFALEEYGHRPAAFHLSERQFKTDPGADPSLAASVVKTADMIPLNWHDNSKPLLNGIALKLDETELSRVVAISGDRLLMGSDFRLRLFAKNGTQTWEQATPGTVWQVNATKDGRLGVASFADGTIRWYRLSDGAELLALFPDADGKRWVAWTPHGYYDASAGADRLIGWHVNRGPEQAADFFPVEQFRDKFNRPDIVALVLDTLDEDEAVRRANAVTGRKGAPSVGDSLPPVVTILSPPDLTSVKASPLTLTYLVRSASPVLDVTALVDARPVASSVPKILMNGTDGTVATVTIDIPPHNAAISLLARNDKATSEAAIVHLSWQGEKDWYKPDLYVLAVGVSHYQNPDLDLMYPDKDAGDFDDVMAAEKGGLYRNVYVRPLTGPHANREEIRRGLSWLVKSTTTRDVAMLFLSGHGQNDAGGHYHYLPYDTDLSDIDLTTVQDFEIQDFLAKVPGKVVAFIDTCFSGGLNPKGPTQPDVDRLANQLASSDKGIVVFTSSTGRQFSRESPEWKNGAFTKALVEALKGGADYQHDNTVSIAELEVYLAHRVHDLTGGQQSPTSAKPKTIEDFVIATVIP